MRSELQKASQIFKMSPLWFLQKLLMVLLVLLISSLTAAYEIPTHKMITEQAIPQSSNYSGFSRIFQLDSARSIINGSDLEDKLFPIIRPRNHFFDPTNGEGLSTSGLPIGEPSLAWGYDGGNSFFSNDYSWTKAREYLYISLTGKDFNGNLIAVTGEERSEYFLKTYRSVGQVMHLIQDLASPAHVRNDLHLPIGLEGDLYEHYVDEQYNPDWAIWYPTVQLGQFPDFWSSSLGLATFTNRNFISQDTNFDNLNIDGQPYYTFPQIAGIVTTNESIVTQFGGMTNVLVDYERNVILDNYTGEIFTNDRLTAFSVFDFEAQELLGRPVYSINDFTLESAANILVRRAVGYSAGLLDYFFRGQIQFVLVDETHVRIRNLSPEPLSNGVIEIYYDNLQNERVFLSDIVVSIPLAPGESTAVIELNPPADNLNPGKYWLVFQGTLGAEEGAVIGSYGLWWIEDWNQELEDGHVWYTTLIDPLRNLTAPGGTIQTTVEEGVLIMQNIVPPGTQLGTSSPGNTDGSQVNEVFIGLFPPDPDEIIDDFPDIFPLTIYPETELQVKIDAMDINALVTGPQCPDAPDHQSASAFQIIDFDFNNGTTLQLTKPDQGFAFAGDIVIDIPLGEEIAINLYALFELNGVPFDEPLELESIALVQQFFAPSCDPITESVEQFLSVSREIARALLTFRCANFGLMGEKLKTE